MIIHDFAIKKFQTCFSFMRGIQITTLQILYACIQIAMFKVWKKTDVNLIVVAFRLFGDIQILIQKSDRISPALQAIRYQSSSDFRHSAFRFAGYPANSISGTSLIFLFKKWRSK
jgi:hypothetical protein